MNRRLPFYSSTVRPPPFLVVLFIVCYGMVSICFWMIDLSMPKGSGGEVNIDSNPDPAVVLLTTVLGCAAAVYALFRLGRYHPALNSGYAVWLKMSPWTAAQPLPLGPVHPVLQDVAVIGVLAAIARWHAHVDPLVPVVAFVMAYLIGMTAMMGFTRRWRHFVALALLWPSLLLTDKHEQVRYILLIAILAVIWHGHRQSLKAFPWAFMETANGGVPNVLQAKITLGVANSPLSSGTTQILGWPYLILSPKMRPPGVSNSANLATSTVFGWWSFCIITVTQPGPSPEWILIFAIFAALMRMAAYGSGTAPPFNVFGRIASGRIIVPGYDKIFVGPLATVLVAVLGDMVTKRSGDWYPAAEAVTFGLVWVVLLGCGPTLRNWVLTGQHQLKPTRSKQVMIKPV